MLLHFINQISPVLKIVTYCYHSGNISLEITLKVEHILCIFIIDLNNLTDLIHKPSSKILQKEDVHQAYLDEIEHTDFVPVVGEDLERHEDLAHSLLPFHLCFKRQNVFHEDLDLFVLTYVVCNLGNLLSRCLG